MVFSALLAFALVRTFPALISYYKDFRNSGLELAAHRGYGQSACKFYGLFPAPNLSVMQFAFSGLVFLFLVVLPALPLCAAELRAPAFGAGLIFYHLYFSQLYCEAHVGAHVTVLIPPALILLALSPALDRAASDIETTDSSAALASAAFTCWCMKIILTSAYCGAGVCKISHSIASMRKGFSSWCTGSTLQAFIFEAMFLSTPSTHTSFGVPTPFSYALQKLHLLHPRALLMPASFGAVAFETLAPLVLMAPAHLASVPFALSGLAFHYGIALLQNIDFLSWWGPAYAFLLADPAAWAGGSLFAQPADGAPVGLLESARAAYAIAPLRVSLAITYVLIHLLAVVALRFFPSVEVLPLSAFPMFGSPQNLFDGRIRKHFWLSDKPHATGTLKNYAFPFCRPQTVRPHEVGSLPFKYFLLSHGGLGSDDLSAEPIVHTNVRLTSAMESAIGKLKSLCNQQSETFAKSADAAPSLLAALEEAKAAFAAAPRLPQKIYSSAGSFEPSCVIDATPTTEAAVAAAPGGSQGAGMGAAFKADKHD